MYEHIPVTDVLTVILNWSIRGIWPTLLFLKWLVKSRIKVEGAHSIAVLCHISWLHSGRRCNSLHATDPTEDLLEDKAFPRTPNEDETFQQEGKMVSSS